MQERGVAATLKHYVANDFETDRYTADVHVDERTLRELYLLAFEQGVREAHAWCVMSASKSVNGRLPTTWPARLEDALVTDVTGTDGVVEYREGIHIGYRAWPRAQRAPAFPFGFGLGYTTWSLGTPQVRTALDGSIEVGVDVSNTSARSGKQVVQVYAHRVASSVDRPVRWVVGFAAVRAEPGETHRTSVTLPLRALGHWDRRWIVEPGDYGISVNTSAVSSRRSPSPCESRCVLDSVEPSAPGARLAAVGASK